jgi:hypothetical protein
MTRRRSGVRVAYRPPQFCTPVTLDRTTHIRTTERVVWPRGDFVLALVYVAFAGYNPFVIAELPGWMDAEFLRNASGTLVIAALLLALVLMFFVRSIGTRLVAIVLLGSAVFGLVHYRQTLEHCDQSGSSCRLFGEVVRADNQS